MKKIIIFCIIILGIILFYIINRNERMDKGNNIVNEKNVETISFIPLNIGEEENIMGGKLLHINDYELLIPKKLIDVGYSINIEDTKLVIKSNDEKYKCILIQLTNNYIEPTDEEQEKLYETSEYKAWYNEDYDIDDDASREKYYEKGDIISCNYYKSLGYTVKNSPDYTLTTKEFNSLIGEFLLDENAEPNSAWKFEYERHKSYDWGKTSMYAIPKGEKKFSGFFCIFEYFDYNDPLTMYDIELWTF